MTSVYNYDENFIYIGDFPALLDPLQTILDGEDVFLLPAKATFVEPPPAVLGQNIVWDPESQEWNYEPIPVPDEE